MTDIDCYILVLDHYPVAVDTDRDALVKKGDLLASIYLSGQAAKKPIDDGTWFPPGDNFENAFLVIYHMTPQIFEHEMAAIARQRAKVPYEYRQEQPHD